MLFLFVHGQPVFLKQLPEQFLVLSLGVLVLVTGLPVGLAMTLGVTSTGMMFDSYRSGYLVLTLGDLVLPLLFLAIGLVVFDIFFLQRLTRLQMYVLR